MRREEERLKAEIRKWGHSLGIIIPKQFVKKLNLKERETVELKLKKTSGDLMSLFGTLKFKESTEKIKKELKEGWKE